MLSEPLFYHICAELGIALNKTMQLTGVRQVFGGDINKTYVLTCSNATFFVKINSAALADMMAKENNGLALLRAANTSLAIPEPMLHGIFEKQSFLVMEYLEKADENATFWQQLATGLAQLHQTTQKEFGLSYNNYIGSLLQSNTPANTWSEFYAQQRIMPLIKKAFTLNCCNAADIRLAESFCSRLPALIPEELAVLLHGDLWSGNKMFTANGKASVYDPAVYFGHREMDLAMTLLFGGFDEHFYHHYNDLYPLQPGWRTRINICQLYPLLVHLVLFGNQYYGRVKAILQQYA